MPLHLDAKRVFMQRSERVKGVEIHPTEPWLLTNLYNGSVVIWDYQNNAVVKSFEVSELPVRSAKFVVRKQWVVAGSDDMHLRVYNYNTMEKVADFEAHTDYIRSVAVHPSLSYVLTSADDMLVKLWDWNKDWQCTQVFEGHSHYVMQVVFNPKDPNTFATASLDCTVKIWSLGSPIPNFTLEGHAKGVNCIDYYPGGDRPYLISGADDATVRVWDYQTKACIQALQGHTGNVSAVAFHPELPLILSASEDSSVRMWHATTYRVEQTFNYGMDRCWALAATKGLNGFAVGCDEGSVVVKMGSDDPMASMDATTGKIVWAKHTEVQSASIKSMGEYQVQDGERLPLAVKDMGTADVFPTFLKHSPNGRFIAVCGDGEYIIYTAVAWRNRHFGQAQDFAWGQDSNLFAVRESGSTIRVFRNFKEATAFKVPFPVVKIFGGRLIGVQAADFVCFYDWDTATLVRRIDVEARDLQWSEGGESLVVLCDASFFVLQYNPAALEQALADGAEINNEDGLGDAFEVVQEVEERVHTGMWVGACFVYLNATWRLNYAVGGETTTIVHLEKPMHLLGYHAQQQRLYLIDRDYAVVTYSLALAVIEYKTLLLRGEEEAAQALLPQIPKSQLDSVARFLAARGQAEKAFHVAVDPDYRFELAVQLGRLSDAMQLAASDESDTKWRQIGELAIKAGAVDEAAEAATRAGDLATLLLIYTAQGNREGMSSLATRAEQQGQHNLAFMGHYLTNNVEKCYEVLVKCKRYPEAAFFARTYLPSRIAEAVGMWREELSTHSQSLTHVADGLADPDRNPEAFPDYPDLLKAENMRQQMGGRDAGDYMDVADEEVADLVALMRSMPAGAPLLSNGNASAPAPAPAAKPRPAPTLEMPATDARVSGISSGSLSMGPRTSDSFSIVNRMPNAGALDGGTPMQPEGGFRGTETGDGGAAAGAAAATAGLATVTETAGAEGAVGAAGVAAGAGAGVAGAEVDDLEGIDDLVRDVDLGDEGADADDQLDLDDDDWGEA